MMKRAAFLLSAAILAASSATAQDRATATAPDSKGPLVGYVVRGGRAPLIIRGWFHQEDAYGGGAVVSEKYDIKDPSSDMALTIARLVAAKYADPAAPLAIQERREQRAYRDNKAAEKQSGVHYVVDLTISLEAHPLIMSLNRYGVSVFGFLTVTDKTTNKVVRRAHCIIFPQDKTPDSPTLTEMFDHDAASLKTMIASGADDCMVALKAGANLE
ncbi:MAG TPA: hypothetical protein VG407_00400 [Caulobacteraceae bacterium]|jgi:hypothetical protein|nr:hypothetical protein [Caulobacteraceae bacterium]